MNNDHENWTVCPPGTLDRMRGQFPAESRQRSIKPYVTGIAVASALAAVLFGLSLLGDRGNPASSNSPDLHPIACHQVRPLLEAYHAKSLDPEMTQAIAKHLTHCDACTALYQEIAARTAVYNAVPTSQLLAQRGQMLGWPGLE